jgi:hypothetical protein
MRSWGTITLALEAVWWCWENGSDESFSGRIIISGPDDVYVTCKVGQSKVGGLHYYVVVDR